MKLCTLCENKEANQTGSHIFTHGLIKSAINQQGIKKRSNKEIIATISSYDLVDIFFGSNVLPENIKDVIDVELTDEKIEELRNKKDPFIRDYLFCGDCEKRFTVAENYFLDNVYKGLENEQGSEKDKFGNSIIHYPKLNSELLRIFLYIQIWRASIAKFNNFQLTNKIEEKLRKVIDENLVLSDLNNTIEKCNSNKVEINSFPMIITFMETSATSDLSENIIYIDKSKFPYMMIINNIVIQFFQKEKHLKDFSQYFWGLYNMIERVKHTNFKNEGLKIGKISDTSRKKVLDRFRQYLVDQTSSRIRSFIIEAHEKMFRTKPTAHFIRYIYSEIYKEKREINANHIISTVSKILYTQILLLREQINKINK